MGHHNRYQSGYHDNAAIHLRAIAGRTGCRIGMEELAEIARSTPSLSRQAKRAAFPTKQRWPELPAALRPVRHAGGSRLRLSFLIARGGIWTLEDE
jgi:hypothetical protein